MVSYITSVVVNIVSLTVFEIFYAEVLRPRSRTVQGHLRLPKVTYSKFMLPIDSPGVISYSTCIEHNIVSVTIFLNI